MAGMRVVVNGGGSPGKWGRQGRRATTRVLFRGVQNAPVNARPPGVASNVRVVVASSWWGTVR